MPPQSSSSTSSSNMIVGGRFTVRQRNANELLEAKQRASIKWLLAKAYNHKTPQELREPFYKDHDDVERLKPHIVRSLANAELYCMALSNLYADPNFHNLNHWGIIQALARKGVCVAEPPDCALTETMLIQTNPIKLSAHMAVTEAIMQLFVKEMVSLDRVTSTVRRFATLSENGKDDPSDQEQALILWVNKCSESLQRKAEQDHVGVQNGGEFKTPSFEKIREWTDLRSGVGFLTSISLYCPEEFPWSDIAGVADSESPTPSMADSLLNIQLVQRFCRDSLPFNFCHLSLEDLIYMHESIKSNVLCFLADLFSGLELRPVIRSAQLPGVKKDQVIEVPDPDFHRNTTLKRLSSVPENMESPKISSIEDAFVVQRGRTVPTLSSVARTSSPATQIDPDKHFKERQNNDTKSEERGESDLNAEPWSLLQQVKNIPVAGRPSDTPRRTSIAGRRSRRNSSDDANTSQLSLENLGGSQDNLSMLGRNPDKEMRTHTGRKSEPVYNNDRFIDNRELEEMEKHQREGSPYGGKNDRAASESPEQKVSFADFRRQKARDQFHSSAINITYSDQEKEDPPKRSSLLQRRDSAKEATPNPPTINRASSSSQLLSNDQSYDTSADAMASQLNSVRVKLEQRRKRIEEEKRKMETLTAKQREKVGQQAFIRAVFKGDLGEDISAVQSRWLSDRNKSQTAPNSRSSDTENVDIENYSKSLTAMNDSLYNLQSDIQRLAQQQSQIQQMMSGSRMDPNNLPYHQSNPMDPQPFYIASPDPPVTPQRRTWGQPQPISFAQQPQMVPDGWQGINRRQQWGGHQQQQQQPPPQRSMSYYNNQYGDQYGSPMHDQWGNPVMSPAGPNYNGQHIEQSQYGYNSPVYSGSGYGYGGQPPAPTPSSPSPYYPAQPATTPRTPFRLHDGPKVISPLATSNPASVTQSPTTSLSVSQRIAALGSLGNRRLSESEVAQQQPLQTVPPSFSRQNSRDSVSSSRDIPPLGLGPSHRTHSSIPAPLEDEMAPQNVSFIDSSAEDEPERNSKLSDRLSQLNISSGSKTYRVHSSDKESSSSPSPTRTRPTISSTFKQQRKGSGGESSAGPASLRSLSGHGLTEEEAEALAAMKTEKLKDDADASKGFVISFDDDTPKKPKPQLKPRRLSSKKNSIVSEMSDGSNSSRKENVPPELMICIDMNMGDDGSDGRGSSPYRSKYQSLNRLKNGSNEPPSWRSYSESENQVSTSDNDGPVIPKFDIDPSVPLETMVTLTGGSESESDGGKTNTGLLIGEALLHVDPNTQEEMQRKKERIMMQSLRRKQQAEDNRHRKDEELRLKREEESKKDEEKQRKKEEEKARREAILHQFKMKKESEKDDEENIPEPVSARPVPKLRTKSTTKIVSRPRPKTIHVDQADVADSISSRGTRGSTSNLTGNNLRRSESRNSVTRGATLPPTPTPASGLSLASMGTGRSAVSRQQPTSRPSSRPSSRRGSNAFLDEHSATLPPSGAVGSKSLDWAAKQAAASRRKQSSNEDSPRMSRLDRNARSVSQPRGKRDSSVSSAYAGEESRLHGNRMLRASRESLQSGITYSARRGSNASVYDDNDYFYGGSMRDLSNRHTGRRKSSSVSHIELPSRVGANSSLLRGGSAGQKGIPTRLPAVVGSLHSLSHISTQRSGQLAASGDGAAKLTKSRSIANLNGPGSLPGYPRRRMGPGGEYDDGASDISSASGFSAYGYRPGTRLYREPSTKSNRSIILNAIEYVVFPGVVNADTRNRVLDVIDRCDCPHFLLLFRDVKCQFRGLYAYYPDTEEVYKIYGVGPKQVTENMFETFFKYNSGGKKFTKIHTKHLTVTIDAFTIHNSLWLGKKARLPDKRDMALVV